MAEMLLNYKRQTSGRCHNCKIRFVWEGKPLLKDAYCPYCGYQLQQTTHLWKGENQHHKPILKGQPLRRF